ncbi:SUR7/PalI family-domain-containing protein [Annulohypoxylon truncatum]|uniref:SUR7/PalI family-domain-containing protein n=1 Tax=Annulohypoxylon truncatum TaxID=327061 RepID=UPI002007CB0C|nr:SUR7/PalI family-domain-containing protein [Annulohypoxylon truncatum]KAI1204881.1 SUR7/PalI family-domain-containing protein [Annulohypoxylon truncatum]
MARPNTYLAPLSLIFLAGSLVMLFFVILSAVTNTSPLKDTFFLRADTSGITGARSVTQWAYFYICGDGNTDCGRATPAAPLGWAWSGDPSSAPASVVGSHGGHTTSFYFYYMWRFGWVFYLIALVFSVLAFFAGFVACCGRLGSAIAGIVALTALFFHTIAVSMMTAVFVKLRNAFMADGRDASLGRYAFGFSWGSWTALLIATILFCVGIRGGGDGTYSGGRRWGRQRSVRSRRSYDMNGRRVKDDYS